MTRYLTTTDPDGTYVTEVARPAVDAPGEPVEAPEHPVGYSNDGDYGTAALIVTEELVVTEIGAPRSSPPREVAVADTEQSLAGRITGGISNAHPDFNFGGEAEPEPVLEPAPEPEPEPVLEEPTADAEE